MRLAVVVVTGLAAVTLAIPAAAQEPPDALTALEAVDASASPQLARAPSIGDSDAMKAFKRKALRLSPRATPAWGTTSWNTVHKQEFYAWTHEGDQLTWEEALDEIGERQLADKVRLNRSIMQWSPLITAGLMSPMFVGLFVGFGGGMMAVDWERGPTQDEIAIPMLGMLAGTAAGGLVSIAAAAGYSLLMPATSVENETVLDEIQDHNKMVADDVGLPREDIPFEYLGY